MKSLKALQTEKSFFSIWRPQPDPMVLLYTSTVCGIVPQTSIVIESLQVELCAMDNGQHVDLTLLNAINLGKRRS